MRAFVSLLLLLALSPCVRAHTGFVCVARSASNIVVDGDVSEWPAGAWQKAPYVNEILSGPTDDRDFSAEYAVAWKDSLLYLAARVADDVHRCPRTGAHIFQGDAVRFSFGIEHEHDLWNRSVSWGYGLSSVTDSVLVGPAGRFARVPAGLVYIDQRVIRNEAAGVTVYEAVAKPPFDISDGAVYGFDFQATDSDEFQDASVGTSPRSLTLPGNGRGDILFTKGAAPLVTLSGQVDGIPSNATARVFGFKGDLLKGSTTCAANGAFSMSLPDGNYRLVAYAGERSSAPGTVNVGRAPDRASLTLTDGLGRINGYVVGRDETTPVRYASVFASRDGTIRARVLTNALGRFSVTGLEKGTYDLTCNVAEGDTVKQVKISRGRIVELEHPFRATLSFDREPVDSVLFAILENRYTYDRDLPLGVEVLEKRDVAGYLREKITFATVNDDRAVGYLALPKAGSGPYPCLVTLHAHDDPGKDRADMEMLRRRFTGAGYAVLALDAKYYNERHHRGQSVYDMQGQPYRRRDASVQTVIDYRRGLDYLATRAEIDTSRIGVFGGSMGAGQAMILGGVEPRIKSVVLRGPGLSADQWDPPPVNDAVNYLPHLGDRPVLILEGPYEHPWASQGAQRIPALVPGEVDMIWYRTTHTVPPELYLDAMESWVRDHL